MILVGDCLEVLRTLDENSVDAIVTDPPYGLEFMGKDWDAPWKQMGVAGGKRTGFGEADGSKFRQNRGTPSFGVVGNPTCLNCGGDKYRKGERKCQCDAPAFPNQTAIQMRAFQEWVTQWAAECFRVLKPGGHLLAFAGTRTHHRMCSGIEDAGFEIRDLVAWVYGSGFPKSHNGEWGGTALKPALEPITVARKPLVGTVEANWLAHGTGALNIDGCRVPMGDEVVTTGQGTSDSIYGGGNGLRPAEMGTQQFQSHALGRWPANLIHDGSDEVLSQFPRTKSGTLTPDMNVQPPTGWSGGSGADRVKSAFTANEGSAARFFYCAKASRADRNDGCAGFEEKPLLWSSGEANPGSFQAEGTKRAAQNNHPTVKPTELMRYLCRLVTPAGGLVLDPFAGSGSTGRGALLEGFRFIGIEREPEYALIAEARIQAVRDRLAAEVANVSPQADLFAEAAA